MATIKNFEDLEVWKMSREVVNLIFIDFKVIKEYCFRDQILRAGISIMNNIAEGFYRNSDSEFRNFLNIAKGSAGEVKSMYYIAEDQKFIREELANERRNHIQKLINSLGSLMTYLKK